MAALAGLGRADRVSAIGSYAVLAREAFPGCVALAREVRPETAGWGPFKRTRTAGLAEFRRAWAAAAVRTVDFGYSGYVLGDYLDAQEAISGVRLVDEDGEQAAALGRVYTAAFPFHTPVFPPDLPRTKLEAYCREEFEEDAPGMVEAILAAHDYYRQGLGEISPRHLVVFLIG